jgi:hypothetical protein
MRSVRKIVSDSYLNNFVTRYNWGCKFQNLAEVFGQLHHHNLLTLGASGSLEVLLTVDKKLRCWI